MANTPTLKPPCRDADRQSGLAWVCAGSGVGHAQTDNHGCSMMVKKENISAVPEVQGDLDEIPADIAAGLSPEDLALAKEIIRIRRRHWEENPEREVWWDKILRRSYEVEGP